MRLRLRLALALGPLPLFALSLTGGAAAQGAPHGASIVQVLGARAEATLAPASRQIGALVAIPSGQSAAELGIDLVAPGIGRLRGPATAIATFASAHPSMHMEVSPPLHTLLDKAGVWTLAPTARITSNVDGTGVLVGVADTGLDVTHPDLLDKDGKSRVAWILDLSLKPIGRHPELEDKFGVKQDGKLVSGAVLSGDDIDEILARNATAPGDEIGHGTHVTAIAASNGGFKPHSIYSGMAPGAKIVFSRVTRDATESIENDDLVRGVSFLFDRGDAEKKPISVNLSLGSDFGPHDGSFLWEQVLASFVGPDHPGHALIVAAGNSGSIADVAIHQSVHVSEGALVRVPIRTGGAINGSVQVWAATRPGGSMAVGLDGPDGEWVAPIPRGTQRAYNRDKFTSGVVNGSSVPQSPVPNGSNGAVVIWSGTWSPGGYAVTLKGQGTVDLFLQATGDASATQSIPASFLAGVREGTVNLPATHPMLIAVGCTVNRPKWLSHNKAEIGLHVPILDVTGGLLAAGHKTRDLADGEMCWFSSAGPTVTGVPKPEISAPGGLVTAAMSKQAHPGQPGSIFSNASCPPAKKGDADSDPTCLQVDDNHGVAVGTSMSAPMVAGAVALLFQKDPTLTQDKIVSLLQAGAHRFRGASPFADQGGPGELDVVGALDALEQMQTPALHLPSREKSWLTLSADFASADGSTPLTVVIELRTVDGVHRADMLGDRLQPMVRINGVPQAAPQLIRKAPGLWSFSVTPAAGQGGAALTVGATFDGVDIVPARTVPISVDIWSSEYSARASGAGCGLALTPTSPRGPIALSLGFFCLVCARRRRRWRGPGALLARDREEPPVGLPYFVVGVERIEAVARVDADDQKARDLVDLHDRHLRLFGTLLRGNDEVPDLPAGAVELHYRPFHLGVLLPGCFDSEAGTLGSAVVRDGDARGAEGHDACGRRGQTPSPCRPVDLPIPAKPGALSQCRRFGVVRAVVSGPEECSGDGELEKEVVDGRAGGEHIFEALAENVEAVGLVVPAKCALIGLGRRERPQRPDEGPRLSAEARVEPTVEERSSRAEERRFARCSGPGVDDHAIVMTLKEGCAFAGEGHRAWHHELREVSGLCAGGSLVGRRRSAPQAGTGHLAGEESVDFAPSADTSIEEGEGAGAVDT